jgi:AcrR family transcriptional regulator
MTDENASRGERTRTEIITVAYRLFLERGYHGTSMRQIAQEAGIALGSIYNHFSSKEDIFLAVFMERNPYRDIVARLNQVQGETLEDILREAARSVVGGLGPRTDFLNLMFIELVEFNRQHIPQVFQVIYPQLLGFAQRFLAGREELRDIPLPIALRAFVGLFFSYAITEIMIADQIPVEGRAEALDHFVDIYLYGLLKDGAAEAGK